MPAELLEEARSGSRGALARLISLIERGGAPARELAALVADAPHPWSIGITGAPGSGKSTLSSRLITAAVDDAPTSDLPSLAVLAIDPSSPFSGGAILGDRIRMNDHATDRRVFIRSMATRGHLGGLALAVPDAVRLIGAVGIPLVLIETVGVGQIELEVASFADTTIVVVTPGWGDSMQANKAGLLEIADLFVINKADRPDLRTARRDLEQMLALAEPRSWMPPIIETVATTGDGIDELWKVACEHRRQTSKPGGEDRARERAAAELRRVLVATAMAEIEGIVGGEAFEATIGRMVRGEIDPYAAAEALRGSATVAG